MGEAKTSKQAPHLQRKVCTIRLAALVPEGMFIDTMDVKLDFRGAVILDPGTTARFRSVLIGRSGLIKKNNRKKRQIIKKKWRAKKQVIEDDFVIQTKKSIPIASACAKKKDRRARMVFKNVISTKIRHPFHETDTTSGSIFIDSTDIIGTFSIKMNLASCQLKGSHQ